MRFESYVVAEMLQRMEQHAVALRPHAVVIAAALSKDEYPAALTASAELHRVLDALVATAEALEDHVVAHDGMGKLGEALDELALRARSFVLLAQLDILSTALDEPTAQSRTREWFSERFPAITDLVAFVRGRVTQIHAIWKPYRQDQQVLPGMTEAERKIIYRTMIRVAQRSLRELRCEPELARFLDSGVAATDLPEIHLACKQIVNVLNLQIDIESSRPRPHNPRRVVATNGAPERR